MQMLKPPNDTRTPEQILQHYTVEKELAATLRDAPKQERARLYAEVYDALFQRVPSHPQLTRQCSAAETREIVSQQMRFLRRFLKPAATYLEIGAGDCALAKDVAEHVAKVYAVDVSAEVVKNAAMPPNGEVILSDGCSIPVPSASVNVAYSNQLMEHLHPDDALEQLRNLYRALTPGGCYVCVTPNRLNGPHDVSQFFDYRASGFHLREYTTGELRQLFTEIGFRRSVPYVRVLGHFFRLPGWLPPLSERGLELLPDRIRTKIAKRLPARWLLGIYLVGIK